ncbi:NUDIX hydrolase [Exiguobacterium sp. NPDC077395]|uniref:NUDIX hydrolase n=1 Tax=Exiguobacterium sp. NPDC077395 TaxID=3390563 RepID=UPI003D055849
MSYISSLREVIGNRPIISVGATILVINQKQEVLMQFRSDTLDWGLPGGSMELGETLEEVAARELKEETGLFAKKFEFIQVFSGSDGYFKYPNGDETYGVIHLYQAKGVHGELLMENGESLALEYFSKENLPKKIEKRAQTLLDVLGDRCFEREHSF